MTINQRSKGQVGEREFCEKLSTGLGLLRCLRRNLDQVRLGGADIVELAPFAIEVKRQQALSINTWWKQALSQTTARNPIPVLAWRKNGMQWTIRMRMSDLVGKKLRKSIPSDQAIAYCDMHLDTFIAIAKLKGIVHEDVVEH